MDSTLKISSTCDDVSPRLRIAHRLPFPFFVLLPPSLTISTYSSDFSFYSFFFFSPPPSLTQLADRFSPSLFRVYGGATQQPPTTSPYQKTKKKKKRKKGEALWMNAKAKENQRNE
jgi:hypothetical protein